MVLFSGFSNPFVLVPALARRLVEGMGGISQGDIFYISP
jgi:hypothetical protein